ncbi:MAG TPA: hypothetical protein VMD08_03890 [Candidatus Baltobacteraceae bacterium]|nr:hypothetical protein [Candidatus Baltobacteraceae bacterium]
MAGKDPQAIAANWASRLGASSQRITDGVNAVTVAPGQAAARQKAVWQQNTANAADKWASRTSQVSLGDWQTAMIQKGAPRVGAGASAAVPKFASFMGQLLPHIDSVKAGLPPRGNLDANIARMVSFTQGMAKFQRRG